MSTAIKGLGVMLPLLLSVAPVAAQCPSEGWQAGDGAPGVSNSVTAMAVWDPDGDGPQPSKLVVGGTFTMAGDVPASRIAMYDPQAHTWSAMGSGMSGSVWAVAVLPNGDVVAGGSFTTAGGVSANRIARWNGSVWSPLGAGMDDRVQALAVASNGDLIAGGSFWDAGGIRVNRIARWNGTAWSRVGSGMNGFNDSVTALLALPNGDLVVGGSFTTAGEVAVSTIARWNGTAWSALGSGVSGGDVSALALMRNGDLVAAGTINNAGGVPVNSIARWDGTAWAPVGSGIQNAVNALAVLPGGDLIAGGNFWTSVGGPSFIARWNGTAWSSLGSGTSSGLNALAVLPNGDLFAGGSFTTAGGFPANRIARYTFPGIPPVVGQHPADTLACQTGAGAFSAAASGTPPLSYQWQVQTGPEEWANLSATPLALPCGGSAIADSPASPTTTISISPCPGESEYRVRCVVDNACGSAASDAAAYTVCPVDTDCSGQLQPADVTAFVIAWFGSLQGGGLAGDFDADGVVGPADVANFVNAWFVAVTTGC